tara:strand:+ start:497 stop:679 length:183 start_codon:yes stop_codon:yes gene_type:complete
MSEEKVVSISRVPTMEQLKRDLMILEINPEYDSMGRIVRKRNLSGVERTMAKSVMGKDNE